MRFGQQEAILEDKTRNKRGVSYRYLLTESAGTKGFSVEIRSSDKGRARARDLTRDRALAERLFQLLWREFVSPEHLNEVLEDLLCFPDEIE